jgi:rhodanese-related sulfurtransferase
MERVSPEEAKRLIDEEGARLVDVRERYEWDEMRVADSELVPLSEYEGDPTQLAPAKNTIFICAHGNRSQVASDIYETTWEGMPSYNLEGGIAAWAAAGLPTQFGPAE